jgi:hypothetical protein
MKNRRWPMMEKNVAVEDTPKKPAIADDEKKQCSFEDQTFTHGTELCLGDICMTCEDGEWDEEARNTGC